MFKKCTVLCVSILSCLFVVFLATMSISSAVNQSRNKPFSETSPIVDFKELVSSSSEIVTGEIKTNSKSFVYDGLTFYKTKIKITSSMKGSLSVGDTMFLLQFSEKENPLSKNNGQLLLFLSDKYTGPIYEGDNVYFANGLKQGAYEIDSTSKKVKKVKRDDPNGLDATVNEVTAQILSTDTDSTSIMDSIRSEMATQGEEKKLNK